MILAAVLSLSVAAAAQNAPAAGEPRVCLPPGVQTTAGYVACEKACALVPEAVTAQVPACPKREAKGGPFFRPLPKRETSQKLADAEKKIGDIKAAEFDGQTGEPEKDGVETTIEPMVGVIRSGNLKAPAVGGAITVEAKKGKWSAEAAGEGLWARGLQGPVVGNYHLEGGVGRKLGDSPVKAILETETERDEFLGVSHAAAVRAGVEVEALDTKKQSLGVAFGVGPNRESHFGGETEKFISPAVAVDYAFKFVPGVRFGQKLEAEFNAKTPSDIEIKSVTELVWDLTEKAALRLSHTFKKRTEPVEGYAGSRSTTMLSLVIHP